MDLARAGAAGRPRATWCSRIAGGDGGARRFRERRSGPCSSGRAASPTRAARGCSWPRERNRDRDEAGRRRASGHRKSGAGFPGVRAGRRDGDPERRPRRRHAAVRDGHLSGAAAAARRRHAGRPGLPIRECRMPALSTAAPRTRALPTAARTRAISAATASPRRTGVRIRASMRVDPGPARAGRRRRHDRPAPAGHTAAWLLPLGRGARLVRDVRRSRAAPPEQANRNLSRTAMPDRLGAGACPAGCLCGTVWVPPGLAVGKAEAKPGCCTSQR